LLDLNFLLQGGDLDLQSTDLHLKGSDNLSILLVAGLVGLLTAFAARHLGLILSLHLQDAGRKGTFEIGTHDLELFQPFLREIGLELLLLDPLSL